MKIRNIAFVSVITAAALSVTACAESEETTGADDTATTTTAVTAVETTTEESTVAVAESTSITLVDGVVREKGEDNDMTAIFGTLTNEGSEDIEIVGFTTSLGDAHYEIHETVDGTMREMSEPLTIPAGGSHELAPGGDHLMIMEYPEPILAGEAVTVTLELADGSTHEMSDIPVRTMNAGDEDYGDLHHDHDHSHDHGSAEDEAADH